MSSPDLPGLPAPNPPLPERARIAAPVDGGERAPTRRPLEFWDRIKFLLLIAGLFWFLVWAEMADNPLLAYRDAYNQTLESRWWLVVLFGAELTRQAHYLLAESSAGYHQLWVRAFEGGASAWVA